MTIAAAPTVRLLHGADMPQLGLGTSPMGNAQTERAVATAIEAGYRLIDTAEAYGNELGVGRGIRASGIAREELFITTKFDRHWHGRDLAAQGYQAGLDRLGLDYADLLLIHWPNPQLDRYVQAFQGLADLLDAGRLKAIGTSNFKPAHLDRIITETGVVPDVNQIQLSPAVTRDQSRAYHHKHGIVTESWSPLGGQGAAVLNQPVIIDIAKEIGRTPAQVILRWNIELGLVTIPKSSNPQRIHENINIFDFTLTPQQTAAITALDHGESTAVDSDKFGH
ncbi:oxidoreductase [Acrocarpospora pleiomorpha]|uniref:Oxidoreductase n=1 Tax=Acrocarpospora pleiomorpha TaxID=90975 RepID=A0A5M3XQF4_9ACTN|nr:aldo/keto reductase [Acrocarpospora pleiomorpha]GES23070.1 oxidoreductase [Acrocarpospora pleiomorpha]